MGLSRARESTITFFSMKLSPLKQQSCAGNNVHTVKYNLIIYGREIYQVM